MAVRFNSSDDHLTRTTNLPPIGSFTMMGWFKIVVDRNNFSTMLALGANSSSTYYAVLTNSDGTTLSLYRGTGAVATGTNLNVGQWYHIAIRCEGTGTNQLKAFLNGTQDIQMNGNSSVTSARLRIMNDNDSDWFNGTGANIKIYGAVLTASEIKAEMYSYKPVRYNNLNAWYPLFSSDYKTIDFSGKKNNLTAAGTTANEAGPSLLNPFGLTYGYQTISAAPTETITLDKWHFDRFPINREIIKVVSF